MTQDLGRSAADKRPFQVFLSYARNDRAQARRVLDVLEQAGLSVWWDDLLEAGSVFTRRTEQALDNADAVVVLWSKASVGSHWVRDEATSGRDRGRLVPISLDGSLPPLGFRQFQSIDISKWNGSPDAAEFRNVLRVIATLAKAELSKEVPASSRKHLPRFPHIRNRAVAAGIAALVIVAGVTGAHFAGTFAGSEPEMDSIAILPFQNLSGDPEQSYFSDGLSEELRALLGESVGLRVAAQTSSKVFGDRTADPKAISNALGVEYLLHGSVRKSGNRIRVSAQLIDGRTGFDSWSETYERNLSDVFAVQSDIATRVADALAVRLAGSGDGTGSRLGGTSTPAAYDAYLRGLALYELALDENSDRAALGQFEAAVAADPRYAAAWAALSRVQTTIANAYPHGRPPAEMYDEAIASARKAIAFAPRLAEAHAALGYVLLNGRLDARAADGPYRQAYRYGAGNADILQSYATFAARVGRFDESRTAIASAVQLDPLNPSAFKTQGVILFAAGDFAGARRAFAKALELNPNMTTVRKTLGQIAYLEKDYPRARAEFEQEGNELSRLQGLAMTLPRLGDEAGGERNFAQMRAKYGDSGLYQQAQVLAQTGTRQEAIATLERAFGAGDAGLVQALNDPLLAPLAGEPRFRQLLQKVGFEVR
jgi:TolB-like protein/Tfp pilus assembly protein PilF